MDTSKAVESVYCSISSPPGSITNIFVPSSLNAKPYGVVVCDETSKGLESCVAAVTLAALPSFETVKVPSSLTVPVSFCAVTSPEASIVMVMVAVVVVVPSESV